VRTLGPSNAFPPAGASDQYIHAHSGDDESRDANHLVHLHRARPHSGGIVAANRRLNLWGKPIFRHQLACVDRGSNCPVPEGIGVKIAPAGGGPNQAAVFKSESR